ncbi:MAG: 1-(5-phosphoribosyl)-5-[(5-phosphoribosylamino)methylideneamino] imidazole-4-carboxamide isomerase [Micrococcaceae bacterium]
MSLFGSPGLTVLPALDVYQGRTVRITQGVADEKKYADPLDIAKQLQEQGAEMIHLVDLDKAFKQGNNDDLIKQVIENLNIPVQLSGGITAFEDVEKGFDFGAERVNVSSEAFEHLRDSTLIASNYGAKVSFSLDVDPVGNFIRPRGGNAALKINLDEALHYLHEIGISKCVVADVTRDGNLAGPNFDLLQYCLSHSTHQIIASGGVSSLSDIRRLDQMATQGLEGVILGKALYEGVFTLAAAKEVASR